MLIKRDLQCEITKFINSPEAIVITGMRRVGKTTLMRMIFDEIPSENKLFFDLDNPRKQLDFDVIDFFKHQLGTLLFFVLLAAVSSIVFQDAGSHLVSFLLSGMLYTVIVIIAAYFMPQVFSITREEYVQILKKASRVIKK